MDGFFSQPGTGNADFVELVALYFRGRGNCDERGYPAEDSDRTDYRQPDLYAAFFLFGGLVRQLADKSRDYHSSSGSQNYPGLPGSGADCHRNFDLSAGQLDAPPRG